jgi:hypothetical protein
MGSKNPNYTYAYSESLGMEIAIKNDGSCLYTEDKVLYNSSERDIMKDTGLNKAVHLFKKVFSGEIVEVIHNE